MIEIFKTNVKEEKEAKKILNILIAEFPKCKINFDLEDCDKILRIEGIDFTVRIIEKRLKKIGFICTVIE